MPVDLYCNWDEPTPVAALPKPTKTAEKADWGDKGWGGEDKEGSAATKKDYASSDDAPTTHKAPGETVCDWEGSNEAVVKDVGNDEGATATHDTDTASKTPNNYPELWTVEKYEELFISIGYKEEVEAMRRTPLDMSMIGENTPPEAAFLVKMCARLFELSKAVQKAIGNPPSNGFGGGFSSQRSFDFGSGGGGGGRGRGRGGRGGGGGGGRTCFKCNEEGHFARECPNSSGGGGGGGFGGGEQRGRGGGRGGRDNSFGRGDDQENSGNRYFSGGNKSFGGGGDAWGSSNSSGGGGGGDAWGFTNSSGGGGGGDWGSYKSSGGGKHGNDNSWDDAPFSKRPRQSDPAPPPADDSWD